MCSRSVVVGRVAIKHSEKVPFIAHDDVVEALPSNGSDQALAVRILPGRTRCRNHFFDPHRLDAPGEATAEDAVAIMQQESRVGFVGKCLDDLLGCPTGGGGCRDVEVQDATPIMRHDQQDIEHSERRGGNDEEVHGRDVRSVVLQERAPGLGGRPRRYRPVAPHGCVTDIDPQLVQFGLDPRRTPCRIRAPHVVDQTPHRRIDSWSAAPGSALPTPVDAESPSVPAHDTHSADRRSDFL